MEQVTDTILMIRPAAFSFNKETATNNIFQNEVEDVAGSVQQKALHQFDKMVDQLREKEINVIIVNDDKSIPRPDAVFPNNWFTASHDGGLHIFSMFAPNRRTEKRADLADLLQLNFEVEYVKDWSFLEQENAFLEGTGSMVMDHQSRIIYACLSERTNLQALEQFAEAMGYRVMPFTAEYKEQAIYHTNVMLSIGDGFAVLCPKVITDHTERVAVAQLLEATGHENIYVEPEHMKAFACNLLQVKNMKGKKFIVASKSAIDVLPNEKTERLRAYGELIIVDVSTIESVNGGSVRCMMAEIFLKKKNQADT